MELENFEKMCLLHICLAVRLSFLAAKETTKHYIINTVHNLSQLHIKIKHYQNVTYLS